MNKWVVYVIKKGNRFYTGITTDLRNRLRQHGHAGPVYFEEQLTRQTAVERERQIKNWNKAKKKSLFSQPATRVSLSPVAHGLRSFNKGDLAKGEILLVTPICHAIAGGDGGSFLRRWTARAS